MPELPEVQTIVNDLQSIVGDEITGFSSHWPKAIKGMAPTTFAKNIIGKQIISIERMAKTIVINLSNESVIVFHLKMTGQLLLSQNNQLSISNFQKNFKLKKENKHTHHLFLLKRHGILEFRDIRKFGTITYSNKDQITNIKANLGIEPLSKEFTSKKLQEILMVRPKQPIKKLLMDARYIVGIGNIYASEILFDAKIDPHTAAEKISPAQQKVLLASIKKILLKAIKMRGTSVSDYRDASGKRGQFQNHLKVYKRHTQKCPNCDTIILKSIIGQRSTFYCPTCQK